LNIGAVAQQVCRQHGKRLHCGQRGIRPGLQPLRLGTLASQQGSQRMGSTRLGFVQGGQLRLCGAQLQLLLLQRLGICQPLLMPNLQELQLSLRLLQLPLDQAALHLGQPDIEITVHHIGHQRHPRCMQLGLRIQHAGRACTARRFGVTKQAKIPAHINAGMKVSVNCRNILQGPRSGADYGAKSRICRTRQQALLTQTQHGLSHIKVLGQRLVHQRIQRGVIPGTPPVGQLRRVRLLSRLLLLPLGWRGPVQLDCLGRSTACQQRQGTQTQTAHAKTRDVKEISQRSWLKL
jgi:hypothetical protein